jgi:hypothetical protein
MSGNPGVADINVVQNIVEATTKDNCPHLGEGDSLAKNIKFPDQEAICHRISSKE